MDRPTAGVSQNVIRRFLYGCYTPPMPRLFSTFLLIIVLLSTATPALAAKKTAPSDPLINQTVNLYCRLKAGKVIYSSTGTGVVINDRGIILTNAHVAQYFLLAKEKGRVSGWCGVRTGSPADEAYTAEVLYIPPAWLSTNLSLISEERPSGTGENDFALLYITGAEKKKILPTTFPFLSLATTIPTEGAAVKVAGYPTNGLSFSDVRNRMLFATASSSVQGVHGFSVGSREDAFTLASSTLAHYGVSGGPVVDASGSLVGIISAKSGDRLRAVSTSYIDRSIKAQTGATLSQIISGDLVSRAAITKLLLPEGTVAALEKGLRAKK